MIQKMFMIRCTLVKPDPKVFDIVCFTGPTIDNVVTQSREFANKTQAIDPLIQINFQLLHAVWKPITFTEEALTMLMEDPSQFSDKEKKL